jgi:hypothetical protein
MGFHPTAEGVAVAYLDTMISVGVATSLPALSAWPIFAGTTRGFVVVDGVAGGSGRDTALRVPVLGVSSWAAVLDSDRPQWGAANALAEDIVAAVHADSSRPVFVRQGAAYNQALVQDMQLLAEPRRLDDPDTGRARFTLDVVLAWVEVPP